LNVTDASATRTQEVRAHVDFGHWELGEPELRRPLSANTIEPQANIVKRTVVDLGLTSERRLRGLEFMPSDRRVVRAAFFTIQETGQWIGSWTPWYGFVNLPKGAAYRLPAGSHIVAEIHYRGAAERVVEQGSLGLYFADRPTDVVSEFVLDAKTPRMRLVADTSVLALRPEVTAGVKSIEVSARKPDGGTEVLLFAKDFSLDWPTPYILKNPVALPKGTELRVTGGIRLTVSVVRPPRQ
jgi:hypothetical protein